MQDRRRAGSALVRLRNRARDLDTPEWCALKSDLDSAKSYVNGLRARLSFYDPEAGPAILSALKRFSVVLQVLDSLESALEKQDLKHLKAAFMKLGPASDELASVLKYAFGLGDELPVFFDLPELNGLFVLGLKVLKGDPVEGQRLAEHLGWLYNWSKTLDAMLGDLQTSDPDEVELHTSLSKSISFIKEAVGGVATFLESGVKQDLGLALSLLHRGTKLLAADLSTAQEIRDRNCQFSKDPILETLYRESQNWVKDEKQPLAVQESLKGLLETHRVSHELAHRFIFLPLNVHQELFSEADALHSEMNGIIATLMQETQPESFLKLLFDFRREAVKLDNIYRQMNSFEKPSLANSPNFRELFKTMEAVYSETMPDTRLRELLTLLRAAHQDYSLQLEELPRTEEDLLVDECLQEHQLGFVELEAYLLNGERHRILKAYEIMLPASLDLAELSENEVPPSFEPEGSLDILDSDMDSAQSRSLRQILSLIKASRTGKTAPEKCLQCLRSLIQNAEAASRTLSFRVRPLALGQGDPESLEYFEQLNVILEYQLDGLNRLERILLNGTSQAVDQVVQELAEVDAYLVDFRESQEKLVGSQPN